MNERARKFAVTLKSMPPLPDSWATVQQARSELERLDTERNDCWHKIEQLRASRVEVEAADALARAEAARRGEPFPKPKVDKVDAEIIASQLRLEALTQAYEMVAAEAIQTLEQLRDDHLETFRAEVAEALPAHRELVEQVIASRQRIAGSGRCCTSSSTSERPERSSESSRRPSTRCARYGKQPGAGILGHRRRPPPRPRTHTAEAHAPPHRTARRRSMSNSFGHALRTAYNTRTRESMNRFFGRQDEDEGDGKPSVVNLDAGATGPRPLDGNAILRAVFEDAVVGKEMRGRYGR